MLIEFAAIEQWMADYILVFARLSGLLMSMVVIGTRTVSPRIRLMLALAITIVAAPLIDVTVTVDLFSVKTVYLIGVQTMMGVAIGFVTRVVFETFVIAGQIIAMQTGLGFASLIDSSTGVNVPALGQMFVMMATLIFLAIDGHLQLIQVVVLSFESLPIDQSALFFVELDKFVLWTEIIFVTAFMMVLSAIIALLVMNLSLGVMTRAAPQLNIFAIGFPIMTVTGMVIIWLLLRSFLPFFLTQMERGQQMVCQMVLLEC